MLAQSLKGQPVRQFQAPRRTIAFGKDQRKDQSEEGPMDQREGWMPEPQTTARPGRDR
jgi:hypothetical protein